jgi:hypothetical protein
MSHTARLIQWQRVFSSFPYAPSEPDQIDDADATLKLVLNIDFIDCKNEVYLAALKITLIVKSASAGLSFGFAVAHGLIETAYCAGVIVLTTKRLLVLRDSVDPSVRLFDEVIATPLSEIMFVYLCCFTLYSSVTVTSGLGSTSSPSCYALKILSSIAFLATKIRHLRCFGSYS